ncbi:tripartite tricarboxylate transporter permease [Aminobacterium mobile]|uniref:tripartite tricarboxylate transporter permease n=1 Tax=Aminobacterium mobile TaxID=81467 RepID=UPI0004661703|nr:tripartite tricarboxylate transporter permease [Aminobacterium mobile]
MTALIQGLIGAFQPEAILFTAAGTVLGIIFGALPGLTSTMAVALLIPVTFGLSPVAGMGMLMGAFCGGTAGGSISSTLLRIPGTPASICTTFDAYPMAQKGQAGLALGTSILVSLIGGLFSAGILMFIAPKLARFALGFGPTEYFSLAVLGLTVIASVSSKSLLKGVIAGFIGVFISFIGTDPVTGMVRYSFGIPNLLSGLNLLPVLIGLFAVSKALEDAETIGSSVKLTSNKGLKGEFPSFITLLERKWIILSSAVIGTIVGILPGAGCSIASFVSYDQAKRLSKTPEEFGKGCIDGVIASETSNNAVTGGALVPMLTLGIPGDSTTAVMLGGLLIHGLRPGPLLFKDTPEIIYGIFAMLLLANVFMFAFQYFGIRLFVKMLKIPRYMLTPFILVMCTIGAYGVGGSLFDVFVMMVFGVIGYIFNKLHYGVAPVVLGFILGGMAETHFRRAFFMYRGDLGVFVTRPVTLLLLVLSLLLIAIPIIRNHKQSKENLTAA